MFNRLRVDVMCVLFLLLYRINARTNLAGRHLKQSAQAQNSIFTFSSKQVRCLAKAAIYGLYTSNHMA